MAISFIAASTEDGGAGSSSETPSEPSGTQEGDVVLCFATLTNNAQDAAWVDPADFTEITQKLNALGNPDILYYLGYKVRGATAGNGYQFSYTGTASAHTVSLVTLRGVDPNNVLDVNYVEGSHFVGTERSGSPPANDAAPAITVVTPGAFVVVLSGYSQQISGDAGPPSGYTELLDALNGASSGRGQYIAGKTVASAGVETPGVYTHTDTNGTADIGNFTLAFRPFIESSGLSPALIRRLRS